MARLARRAHAIRCRYMTAPHKAVFLDRDGVINATVVRRGKPRAPQDMSEWVWVEGVHETLTELRARGYLLVVVTNQPDVSRGWQTRAQVDAFHQLVERSLPIARVYTCFHDVVDACECRKPKPGMLHVAGAELGIDLGRSFMVGDRDSDVEAGRAAGCATIYLRHADDASAPAGADHEIQALHELLAIIG
jgi:D-glycero-D-manno-heptose 1,7-bisphosphate phosphatase